MRRDQVFADDASRNQVLLNDSLEDRGITLPVPRTFRVDDGDRAAFADAQAIRLRAQDATLLRKLQLLEPSLEELPRHKAPFLVAAFGFRLIAAKKDVAPRDRHADAGRNLTLGIGHAGSIFNACPAA